ncbi:uncharacterized protein BO97DRAFT_438042 [Aspergillus homomorphus CBS 101889]|uniref:Myb-like domain-containing protein n=1 Tax=Aspergillus homomorphus (strain CBS 101889) TaxID=1450537 RepID=A0A395HIT8_ASPHC|nr:hypothetical protein BO97DRAFT_438042 [Aspergillus homomorphus CBS 101889]RAL07842.1 hypothetical protein BO97DRAFT_438042 [Aspergillus homomorphus CBS 101889]
MDNSIDPVILADDRPWMIRELQSTLPDDSFSISETSCPYPGTPVVLCEVSIHEPDLDAQPKWQDSRPRSLSPHSQGPAQKSTFFDNTEADVLLCISRPEAFTCVLCPVQRINTSFPALRTHFLSVSTNERLEFLSWLFDGALPRCLVDLDPKMLKDQDQMPACDMDHLSNFHRHCGASRKGKPWSSEEESLLLKLRRYEKRPWSEVARL